MSTAEIIKHLRGQISGLRMARGILAFHAEPQFDRDGVHKDVLDQLDRSLAECMRGLDAAVGVFMDVRASTRAAVEKAVADRLALWRSGAWSTKPIRDAEMVDEGTP